MSGALLAFHGYTQNGAGFAAGAQPLVSLLPTGSSVIFPDAPHLCTADSVASFYARFPGARPQPPHRTWWRASDNGEVYGGWEETLALVRDLAERHAPLGVLGFSQGAMLATLVAALAARGELPPLRFAVLIAGRVPRALSLAPLLETKIRIPSLHVWGRRDGLCEPVAPELVKCFDPNSSNALIWSGSHVLPTQGFPARAIAAFVASQAG